MLSLAFVIAGLAAASLAAPTEVAEREIEERGLATGPCTRSLYDTRSRSDEVNSLRDLFR
jgi:hypothetical protein